MSERAREKFATQVNPDVLEAVRQIARTEGCQLQSLVDEALNDLIEKRTRSTPRSHVMTAYRASHAKFGPLYQKLAE